MSQIFTQYDVKRLDVLLKKYPERITFAKDLEGKLTSSNDNIIINVSLDWEIRQIAHIIAAKLGWHSKKIMSDYDYGCYGGKCSKCHTLLIDPEILPLGYCCTLCHGGCTNGCNCYGVSSGKCWNGDILFSRNPIKQGRKTRRRKNRWKFGKISF